MSVKLKKSVVKIKKSNDKKLCSYCVKETNVIYVTNEVNATFVVCSFCGEILIK